MSRYAGPLIDVHPDPRYLEAKRHELALLGSELCAQQDTEQTR